MTTTKVLADKDVSSILFHYVSFLNREYISVADIEWNILEFKSSVCGMDSKFISFITWSGHATECLIVGRGGGEEAVA